MVPARSGFKEIDMGIPTFGDNTMLNDLVYDKLRSDSAILENLSPKYISTRYLEGPDGYVITELLHPSTLKTPGEPRPIDRDVWRRAIVDGVKMGSFGLGSVRNGQIACAYFKETPDILFAGDEAIIHERYCVKKAEPVPPEPIPVPITGTMEEDEPGPPKPPPTDDIKTLRLDFKVPFGKVSSLMGVLNLLQNKFSHLEVSIKATDGKITQEDYESKILEAFDQSGIKLK
jgi:hypothetical protein